MLLQDPCFVNSRIYVNGWSQTLHCPRDLLSFSPMDFSSALRDVPQLRGTPSIPISFSASSSCPLVIRTPLTHSANSSCRRLPPRRALPTRWSLWGRRAGTFSISLLLIKPFRDHSHVHIDIFILFCYSSFLFLLHFAYFAFETFVKIFQNFLTNFNIFWSEIAWVDR